MKGQNGEEWQKAFQEMVLGEHENISLEMLQKLARAHREGWKAGVSFMQSEETEDPCGHECDRAVLSVLREAQQSNARLQSRFDHGSMARHTVNETNDKILEVLRLLGG